MVSHSNVKVTIWQIKTYPFALSGTALKTKMMMLIQKNQYECSFCSAMSICHCGLYLEINRIMYIEYKKIIMMYEDIGLKRIYQCSCFYETSEYLTTFSTNGSIVCIYEFVLYTHFKIWHNIPIFPRIHNTTNWKSSVCRTSIYWLTTGRVS